MDFWTIVKIVIGAAVDLLFVLAFIAACIWLVVQVVRAIRKEYSWPEDRGRVALLVGLVIFVVLLLMMATYHFGMEFVKAIRILEQK